MLKFFKYHGLGNDFVLIDNMDLSAPMDADFVQQVCRRNFGVGADGVLYIMPGIGTDLTVRIMNADGTEAEMCGNGIRCVARYAADNGLFDDTFTIHTISGDTAVTVTDDKDFTVEVDMGAPKLDCKDIPMACDGRFIDKELEINGMKVKGTAVSMGNPHFVIFDELSDEEIEMLGPAIRSHPLFPNGTNVGFAKVSNGKIHLRVYERGAGWTLACGTGACAAAVAAAVNGTVPFDEPVDVHLPGGWLKITVDMDLEHVRMAGPAEPVFEGILIE